jgi:hypothetical protein
MPVEERNQFAAFSLKIGVLCADLNSELKKRTEYLVL